MEQIVSSHRDVAAGGELNFWNHEAVALAGPVDWRPDEPAIARMARDYETILCRAAGTDARRVTDKALSNCLWIGLHP